ncbi:MAG: hypothetical protein ACP5OZ_02460 [Candidatus Woesearchaeota archaeon]
MEENKNQGKINGTPEKSINALLGELSYLISFYSKQNFGFSENMIKNYKRETLEKLLEVFPDKSYYETKDSGLILGFFLSLTNPKETIDFFEKIYDFCYDKNINEAKEQIKNLARKYAEKSLEKIINKTGLDITKEFRECYIRVIANYDFYKIVNGPKEKQNNKTKEELANDLYSRIKKLYKDYSILKEKEKENYLDFATRTRNNILMETHDFETFVKWIKNYCKDYYKGKIPEIEEFSKILNAKYKIIETPISGEGKAAITLEFWLKEKPKLKIAFEQEITFENEAELDDNLRYYKQSVLYELGLSKEEPKLPNNEIEIYNLLLKNKQKQ